MENLPKVGKTNALSKPVTSNSVSTPQESKGVNNDKVIAPGMFKINPFKISRDEKKVPNTVRASDKKKPITVSQPPVITKKDVNSDDVISKIVCTMCKKCLIFVNHDKCLRNYMNGKNSSGKKQKAKVSVKEIQMKYQPKVTKPKKVGTLERLATPKPRKYRFLLRWSPTGRLFDQKGNIVDSNEFESQSNCSKGDNACTSNILEPKIKWFPNSTSLLDSLWEHSCFGNDHVAAILGFGDLQWANILITRVYFVEGLGHNLFLVGQFCDSDLEDDYIGGQSSPTGRTVPSTQEPQVRQSSMASTTIADTVPTPTNSSSLATNIPINSKDVDELNSNAIVDVNMFVNPFVNSSTSATASSYLQNVDPSNMHTFYQPYPHEFQWTKDHPLEQVIGGPSRPVLIRNQL
nr:integrase, catalytic region, zinc finger, CCHC-type, peptidase aspartic, catalytic [Tanacetum cinerariifolium]